MNNQKERTGRTKIIRTLFMFLVLLLILDNTNAVGTDMNDLQDIMQSATSSDNLVITSGAIAKSVTCNVVEFMQKLFAPVMTGVIVGSGIMAIFGRLSWSAIAVVIICTTLFFGAGEGIAEISGHRCT